MLACLGLASPCARKGGGQGPLQAIEMESAISDAIVRPYSRVAKIEDFFLPHGSLQHGHFSKFLSVASGSVTDGVGIPPATVLTTARHGFSLTCVRRNT